MAERWYVRFEGDIRDNEFTVLGHTAADALRSATREAHTAPPSAQCAHLPRVGPEALAPMDGHRLLASVCTLWDGAIDDSDSRSSRPACRTPIRRHLSPRAPPDLLSEWR